MATALDLLMSAKEDVNLLSEESDICTIDAKTRVIFVPSTIVVGGVQSDKNAERIKFSCPKIVGDNLDLSKFSVRINFENVSSVDFNVSIKDQYICDDVAVDGENVTFSWLIGRNAARYMGTVRFIVCAVKTDSDSNISVEWNTTIAEVPVLEGIEIDQPQIGQEEKDVINQLLELTKNTSAEAVQNVNSAKEQAIKDIQSVSQPDTTLTIEGGLAEAKATGEAIGSIKGDLVHINPNTVPIYSHNLFDKSKVTNGYYVQYDTGNLIANSIFSVSDFIYVKPNTNYNFHISSKPNERVQQMAFFDINRKYISGLSNQGINQDINVTTPNNAYYIRWSIVNSNIGNVIIEQGNAYSYYSPYSEYSSLSSEKIVTVGAGGVFLYLIDALKKTSNDTVIKLLEGEFDIEEEYKYFYGSDFWTTQYQGYATSEDPFMRGLWLGKGRKLISDGGSVVKMIYSGDRSTVRSNFSVFANDTDVTIDGIVIKYGSIRYAIHDDFQPNGGNVYFRNIVFEGSPFSDSVIGAGLGVNTNYLIDNCIFIGNTKTYDISYHGNTDARKTSNKCKVIVKNCYGNKKCAFRWYGTSKKITDCIVNNSHFSDIECVAYDESQTIENMRLTSYCNEVN